MMTKQYYFDVLPLHPPPEKLETLTSYLLRLAEMNGIKSKTDLATVCFLGNLSGIKALTALRDYPLSSFESLEQITGCSASKLLQTTFFHLGRKFGYSADRSRLREFLYTSLANSLRYCPLCLCESSYYSLTWRFLGLRGCHKHGCQLLDYCPHCKHELPFMSLPLKIGICPVCKGDLRLGVPEILTEEGCREASIFAQEIEFSLSPQEWESTYPSIAKNVGREYALLRQEKGYTALEVKGYIGVLESSLKVADIDFGRLKYATFQDYRLYAKYLSVSLRDIFGLVLTRAEGEPCFEKLRREFLPSEEEVLEKVQRIVDQLKSEGKQVTRKIIRDELSISESSLRGYPRVKDFLDEHAGKFHYRQKEHVQLRKQEIFEQVSQAIEHLSHLGEPITYKSVGDFIGIFATNLKNYPRATALIREHGNFDDFNKKKHVQREEELLAQVRDIVQQMRDRGQTITRKAIAKEVGVHPQTLRLSGKVKEFLDREVGCRISSRKQEELSKEKENRLLIEVEVSVQKLEETGQKVSKRAICDLVGVSFITLMILPRVNLLIEEKVKFYQELYTRSREDELFEQAKESIDVLRKSGQKATQYTVAKAVGVTKSTFKQYPRIMRLLEENAEMQAKIHENKMMLRVKEAIEILKVKENKITIDKVCRQLGIDSANLYHYPSVISFVRNIANESRKQDKEKQFLLREEKLVSSVLEAIKQLQAQGYSVSLTTVARILHISIAKLNYYPRVMLILNEVFSLQIKPEKEA